jgi:hypothetical protein
MADQAGAPQSEDEVIDALTRVLARACRKLGEAGRAQEAGRLAAAGWAAVRVDHARQARHLDGVMHHIARLEATQETESAGWTASTAEPDR